MPRSPTSGAPDHVARPLARGVDIVDTLALLALLPSWLGLLGGRSWLLDLFASVAILAWAAWRRRRLVLTLAGPTLLLNALLIGQLAVHPSVSRERWRNAQVLRFGLRAMPSVGVQMNRQGREFVLIGTHPLSPTGPRRARVSDRQFAWLANHVQQLKEPVLVVGDMNATPWSVGLRIATASNLGFRSLDAPSAPTWHARSPFAIPVDHALRTAPLVVTDRKAGPSTPTTGPDLPWVRTRNATCSSWSPHACSLPVSVAGHARGVDPLARCAIQP